MHFETSKIIRSLRHVHDQIESKIGFAYLHIWQTGYICRTMKKFLRVEINIKLEHQSRVFVAVAKRKHSTPLHTIPFHSILSFVILFVILSFLVCLFVALKCWNVSLYFSHNIHSLFCWHHIARLYSDSKWERSHNRSDQNRRRKSWEFFIVKWIQDTIEGAVVFMIFDIDWVQLSTELTKNAVLSSLHAHTPK